MTATLWIPCGALAAALGLYLLMHATTNRAVAARWTGWGLYTLGGVAIARVVLKPTGSFWSLLLFCLLSAAALLCATVGAVKRPPGSTHQGEDARWFLGAVMAVSAILIWSGIYWTSGALLTAAVLLVWMTGRAASLEADDVKRSFREPAFACVMWGLLIWGTMTAVRQWPYSPDAAGSHYGPRSNPVALACGMLAVGVLPIVTREQLHSRLFGAANLLSGVLLVSSTGAERGQTESFCMTVLGCTAVYVGFIVHSVRNGSASMEADPLSVRGDV